jgi:hypothetical protein
LVEVVLVETRLTLGQVGSNSGDIPGSQLPIEVLIDPVQDLGAVGVTVVWFLTHAHSPPVDSVA